MNPTLKVYAICCVILFIKMYSIGLYQAYSRITKKSFVNPEDAKAFSKNQVATGELPEVEKANKAYRNDLENIPIFLALGLVYVMLDCWEQGAVIYFWTFTIARVFHTVSYLRSLQPWRTISFSVGSTMSFIISIHILLKVLG